MGRLRHIINSFLKFLIYSYILYIFMEDRDIVNKVITSEWQCAGFWGPSYYVGVKVTSNSEHGCAPALAQCVGGLAEVHALIVAPDGLDEEAGVFQSVGLYVICHMYHMLVICYKLAVLLFMLVRKGVTSWNILSFDLITEHTNVSQRQYFIWNVLYENLPQSDLASSLLGLTSLHPADGG